MTFYRRQLQLTDLSPIYLHLPPSSWGDCPPSAVLQCSLQNCRDPVRTLPSCWSCYEVRGHWTLQSLFTGMEGRLSHEPSHVLSCYRQQSISQAACCKSLTEPRNIFLYTFSQWETDIISTFLVKKAKCQKNTVFSLAIINCHNPTKWWVGEIKQCRW